MTEPIASLGEAVAALGALPMPVGPQQQGDPVAAGRRLDLLALMDDQVASKVSPVLAAVLDEAERLRARVAELDALHKQAVRRGMEMCGKARKALGRVSELEAERHTTNEALDDAVQALRAMRSAPAAGKPKDPRACANCGSAPELWCPDCAACQRGCYGGFKDNPCTHPNAGWPKSGPSVERSADRLTQFFAPVAALREDDPNGLHHTYRVGRDLPELGGGS